jgi:catechol 2,3-dioxygenase-like lactoylglutathione lyase family enzyme
MKAIASIAFACGLAAATLPTIHPETQGKPMMLGSFTVCLAVKDIKASRTFYEKLDFKEVAGDMAQNWIVLQNGTTKIGLFQGMFDRNMLTFNPGQTEQRETLKDFQDVRELQRIVKERGITLQGEADEATDGPASIMFTDPDGNPILIDQYVASPKR